MSVYTRAKITACKLRLLGSTRAGFDYPQRYAVADIHLPLAYSEAAALAIIPAIRRTIEREANFTAKRILPADHRQRVERGSTKNLHFDHDIAFSKVGERSRWRLGFNALVETIYDDNSCPRP